MHVSIVAGRGGRDLHVTHHVIGCVKGGEGLAHTSCDWLREGRGGTCM